MSTVITQEIHILKKVLGEHVIDNIVKEIKNTIASAPTKRPENMSLSLNIFADLIYDEDGISRLIDFNQVGSIFIAQVFDKNSNKPYVFLAYSIYDLLETFNDTKRSDPLHSPYIRLFESATRVLYNVMSVEAPKNYIDEHCKRIEDERSLNEIGKYKILFNLANGPVSVDVICNPHVLSVSNPYEVNELTKLADNICGEITFKILEGIPPFKHAFCVSKDSQETLESLLTDEEKELINSVDTVIGWIPSAFELAIDEPYIQLKDVRLINFMGVSFIDAVVRPSALMWQDKFVKNVHAGTGAYGNSSDTEPVDQTVNQDKVIVTQTGINGVNVISLSAIESDLREWTSTNRNQQDAKHKWFALDLVFSAEDIAAGLVYNNDTIIDNTVLDAPEGENTLTVWVKLDEIKDTEKVITISRLDNAEEVETIRIQASLFPEM